MFVWAQGHDQTIESGTDIRLESKEILWLKKCAWSWYPYRLPAQRVNGRKWALPILVL